MPATIKNPILIVRWRATPLDPNNKIAHNIAANASMLSIISFLFLLPARRAFFSTLFIGHDDEVARPRGKIWTIHPRFNVHYAYYKCIIIRSTMNEWEASAVGWHFLQPLYCSTGIVMETSAHEHYGSDKQRKLKNEQNRTCSSAESSGNMLCASNIMLFR